jgi:predicted nicotinamide N-methyase
MTLHTTAGDIELEELEIEIGGRRWSLLHASAVLSHDDENRFLTGDHAIPYGLVLWPASIALAHEVVTRDVAGLHVLELGAGTGLPGIVAAARGAHVVQTDRQKVALFVARQNAERNGLTTVVHREPDWTSWTDDERYHLVLGSDVLYAARLHPHLRAIFERNLAPGGTVLLSDPFRKASVPFLEAMEAGGWSITFDKWSVAAKPPERAVGVFRLTR